jgi:hypothetical protein
MSADFSAPIGRVNATDGLDGAAREDAAREREEREHDAWALAILQAVVDVRPRLSLPLAAEAAETTTARGQSVKLPTPVQADAAGSETAGEISAPSTEATAHEPGLPSRLIAELSDSQLGRMELSVARGVNGLHIVINVADAHVKALIEAERALLLKSLQGSGLRVDSVEIGSQLAPGTALAPEEAAQERALARGRGSLSLRSGSARWRGYSAPPEEEPEEDTERVDLTA